ncbi:MAG: histidinol-phosphate transaminase [Chloroflexi bacterium]|nr:histidinol-phosphate transaminase [Chloroflexota bacterium]
MNVENLIARHLREMSPYTPIVPFDVLSKRLGIARSEIVKLDANENPYGPSPRALDALASADMLHIYPDPDQTALREAIASFIGIRAQHILCGSGVDEVIDIIGRAFIEAGDAIIDLPPTFGMYRFEADVVHARYITVPRRADFSLDVPAICERVNTLPHQGAGQPKLLFVANPNNPDGSLVTDSDLKELLKLPLVVVLDEAYIDFSSQPSRASWVSENDNLIVLRTFSKLAGLAGMRVGYGVFPLTVIQHLWKIKQPYTPNAAGAVAAIAALSDPGYLRDTVQKLVSERERLGEYLSSFDWLHIYPSEANFLLCRVSERATGYRNARHLKYTLEQQGILVRYFDKEGLRDCIRISVGRPGDTDKLIAALKQLSGQGESR